MNPNHRWRHIANLNQNQRGFVSPARPSPRHITLRGLTLAQIEAYAIRSCYERLRGHRLAMAKELGIAKATLLRKLDRLGLRKPRVHRTASPTARVPAIDCRPDLRCACGG